MSDFPLTMFPAEPIVVGTTPMLSPEIVTFGATSAAAAWPSANLAIFVPVTIAAPLLAVKLFVINGTVSGNIDVGIYSSQGNRIVSIGTTAQAGASGVQSFDITDTLLNPALYYLAVAMDNATGQVNRVNPSAVNGRMCGVLQAATSFVLPATVTFAALAQAFIPMVYMTGNVTV